MKSIVTIFTMLLTLGLSGQGTTISVVSKPNDFLNGVYYSAIDMMNFDLYQSKSGLSSKRDNAYVYCKIEDDSVIIIQRKIHPKRAYRLDKKDKLFNHCNNRLTGKLKFKNDTLSLNYVNLNQSCKGYKIGALPEKVKISLDYETLEFYISLYSHYKLPVTKRSLKRNFNNSRNIYEAQSVKFAMLKEI